MATRLFLVCGLAEALTCAALRDAELNDNADTILAIYGRPISMPPHLLRETLAEADRFGPWARIVDLVDATMQIEDALSRSKDEGVRLARQVVGATPDEIVTHSPDRLFEGAIIAAFPQASVVTFDNGLASHLPLRRYDGAWSHKRPGQLAEDVLKRIRAAHYLFGDVLGHPEHAQTLARTINASALRRAAERAMGARPHPSLDGLDCEAASLVLGTSFYRTNRISFEQERAIYLNAIARLRAIGRENIFYKEHPRASQGPLISERDGVRMIETDMPVEMWPLAPRLEGSYSISSSALLSLRLLYGVEGYSIGHTLNLGDTLPVVKLAASATKAWPPL